MYKINAKIPGWNNKEILEVISHQASLVPENGEILELGALFGRSTYALGNNKHPSVKLTVIDIWPTLLLDNHKEINFHDDKAGAAELALLTSKFKTNPDRLESADFVELHKFYSGDIPNSRYIKGNTNMRNAALPKYDFIFHDASHDYQDVYDDLVHWFPKLKQDGIFIVDDYDATGFPGLVKAVDEFVSENSVELTHVTDRNVSLRRK